MSRPQNRKVARAASIGGGVTARGKTSTGWYMLLATIMAVGIGLVFVSRQERLKELSLTDPSGPPTAGDHWHTAYGIYICDTFLPNLPQPDALLGLHTHNDGLIHVEPNVGPEQRLNTGANANLGRFMQGQPGFVVTETSLKVPGQPDKKDGDKCGDKVAKVQIAIWPSRTAEKSEPYPGDPKRIHIKDNQLITIGFVPEGTALPKPPSEPALNDPNAGETAPAGGLSAPPGGSSAPTGNPEAPPISAGIMPPEESAPAPAPAP